MVCWNKTVQNYELFLVTSFPISFAISASSMLLAFFLLQVYTVTNFLFKAPHSWTRNRVTLYFISVWMLAISLGCNCWLFHLNPNFDKYKKWRTVRVAVWVTIAIIKIVLNILTCWEILNKRRNSRKPQSSKHRRITTTVMIIVAVEVFTAVP